LGLNILKSARLFCLAAVACALLAVAAEDDANPVAQQVSSETRAVTPRPPLRLTATLQTGFADSFQLTLGGTFGAGPAFQNRVTFGLNNAFLAGDALTVSGWNTHDTPSHENSWTAQVCYRLRVLNRSKHVLHAGASFERWRFPGVLQGAQDWLSAYNATYNTRVKSVPVTVQSNGWTLLHSPLKTGSLVHTQVWIDHPVMQSDRLRVAFRHGPQHTYSWQFYGTNGHRVFRYATAVVFSQTRQSLEVGYRQQFGLQPRIVDNRYWHVLYTRVF
jgi:hypothetical protein